MEGDKISWLDEYRSRLLACTRATLSQLEIRILANFMQFRNGIRGSKAVKGSVGYAHSLCYQPASLTRIEGIIFRSRSRLISALISLTGYPLGEPARFKWERLERKRVITFLHVPVNANMFMSCFLRGVVMILRGDVSLLWKFDWRERLLQQPVRRSTLNNELPPNKTFYYILKHL